MNRPARSLAFPSLINRSSAWTRRGVLAIGLVLASAQAHALTLLATYNFTDSSAPASSYFKDSSGNGRHLTSFAGSNGYAVSSDHSSAGPSDSSLSFNGAQGVPYANLSLSGYTALTFDWYMKTGDTRANDNTIFQIGTGGTTAGFLSIKLLTNSEGNPTLLRIVQRQTTPSYYQADFTIPDPENWANYSLSIDNSIIGAGRMTLLINGVAQTQTGAGLTSSVVGTFQNELRIGAAASTTDRYTGNLQDVSLFSGAVPEPTSAVMLILGASGLLLRRRRLS
jgi:hypothetical protein